MLSDAQVAQVLRDGESFAVEFSESLTNTDKFGEAICAFANDMTGSGNPGYLLLGVGRDGRPTGATIDERVLESLASLRDNGNTLPIPDMSVYRATVDGRAVAVVEVRPSTIPPVRYKQVVWIRTGPSKDRASAEQERRLEERRVDRARTWDARACEGAGLEDLALEVFTQNYLARAVSAEVLRENGRSVEEQLGSLRLFHRKLGVPTNAAVLLFGKDPLYFVPGAYVQYVRYAGEHKADEVEQERRLSGDLVFVLRELDALARAVARVRPVRRPDLSEDLVADYPEVALHEIFVNAVIHRNYEGSTTPVLINHFSDRMEVHNPGSLYGDLTREEFPDGTAYRNPVLAEAAKVLGFANRFGRGIALANVALERNGNPKAEFSLTSPNHLTVTLWKRP
ncbi:MAG: putative DNA binding domain-containing protein [Phycisphaerales bacterium]|nr:putative DNA binding domain-containing protein [Phycisphaerales bacterium]